MERKNTRKHKISWPSSNAYWKGNRRLTMMFGLEKAGYLTYLLDKQKYWLKKKPQFKGSFFIPHEQQASELGETIRKIIILKNWAKSLGFISTEMRKSRPPKEWYTVNNDAVQYYLNHLQIRGVKNDKQYPPEMGGLKNGDFDTRDHTISEDTSKNQYPPENGGILMKINKGERSLARAERATAKKQELLTCPNKKTFGKDHPDCLIFDCPIEKQCRIEYREKYKPPEEEKVYRNYQCGICPYGHKFGIDTDQFDDCADCEGWDDLN